MATAKILVMVRREPAIDVRWNGARSTPVEARARRDVHEALAEEVAFFLLRGGFVRTVRGDDDDPSQWDVVYLRLEEFCKLRNGAAEEELISFKVIGKAPTLPSRPVDPLPYEKGRLE